MFETLIWLVPAAVLLGGLSSPRGGLLVLAACLPLFGSPPGGPYLAALDVAAVVAIAAALRAPRPPSTLLDRAVLLFVAVSALSLVPLAYQPPSWHPRVLLDLLAAFPDVEPWSLLYTWRAFANLLLGWGLYHSMRRAFAGRSLRPLGAALALGCAPILLLGLASQMDLVDLGAYRSKGGALYATRLHSLFFHSGWLAEFLVLAVPPAIAAVLGRRVWQRIAALVFATLAGTVIFLTEQRGAWFAALAQILLLGALWLPGAIRHRRRLWFASLTALPVVVIVAASVVVRPDIFEAAEERSRNAFTDLSGRPLAWKASVEMATERPALGWGIGSFAPASHQLGVIEGHYTWLTSHNHVLMLAAERGLLGLGAFVLVCLAIMVTLWRALSADPPCDTALARGLAVGLFGIAVFGAVQYLFFLKMIEWLFWMLAGAVALLAPTEVTGRSKTTTGTLIAVCGLLLLVRAFAVPPITAPGDRSFGFHRVEQGASHEYEWTDKVAARRLTWEDEVLVLALANGHPRAQSHPVEVVVRIDGEKRLEVEIAGGWQHFKVVLGPAQRQWLLLEIEARPSFRPYADFGNDPELGPSTDIRRLGVAVGPVVWAASADEPPTKEQTDAEATNN